MEKHANISSNAAVIIENLRAQIARLTQELKAERAEKERLARVLEEHL
jgi:hypothetical protein